MRGFKSCRGTSVGSFKLEDESGRGDCEELRSVEGGWVVGGVVTLGVDARSLRIAAAAAESRGDCTPSVLRTSVEDGGTGPPFCALVVGGTSGGDGAPLAVAACGS